MRRIEGQARGVHRMIEEEKYCIDILTQIGALTSALQVVAVGLLDDHLKHCVLDAARAGGAEAEAKLQEATAAITRLVATNRTEYHTRLGYASLFNAFQHAISVGNSTRGE